MADMAAHEEGGRNHEKVQHAPGKHGNIGLLPRQRLDGRDVGRSVERQRQVSSGRSTADRSEQFHYICGTVMKTRRTCRKSKKLSATSVSLAKSAEKSTSRCSCRRQDSTYRDTDGQRRGLRGGLTRRQLVRPIPAAAAAAGSRAGAGGGLNPPPGGPCLLWTAARWSEDAGETSAEHTALELTPYCLHQAR